MAICQLEAALEGGDTAEVDRQFVAAGEELEAPSPGGFVTLAEKDLAATLAFARELGVALPGAGLAQQLMGRVYGLEDDKRR